MHKSALLKARRLIVLAVLFASGCVKHSVQEGIHVFTNEWWVPVVVFLGGILGAVIGFVIRDSAGRFAWALLILGPIASLGFAPSLWMDRATVDEKEFHLRTGIWGLTAVHDIVLDQLTSVRLTSETRRSRRGRSTSYYMVCSMSNGETKKVPLGNKVCETAFPFVLAEIVKREIPVANDIEE